MSFEVEIIKIPEVSFPGWIKKALIGVQLPAQHIQQQTIKNIFSERRTDDDGIIIVKTEKVVDRLSQQSSRAAGWLQKNVLPQKKWLQFGPTEYQAV